GELTPNEADRDAAVGQVVHRPRDARHLTRIDLRLNRGHGEERSTTEDTEEYFEESPCPHRPHNLAPHCLQNFASASRAAPHSPQNRACGGVASSEMPPSRLTRSRSTWAL